ncbi:MAG TPA: hypothetical protein VMA32_08100 [Streptosporangiaceae bacterium]|nr:hypothetical protein [Streptosporangiaceae bacterium]
MTSQPDSPVTDRVGMQEEPLEAGQATQDPDLVIVAGEVVDEDADDLAADESDGAINGGAITGGTGELGPQWHDIQAMFVDDPRGSVELAAAAADAAVGTLVQTLHQHQSALAPAGSTSADPGGTEQLREALRGYRVFCESLTEIGQRLAQQATVTQ